jgi:AcrR family transcriptional regulator
MGTALRSDAAANRDRVLEAARQAFAELGPEAKVEEVAQRAGVGVGTIYRRFPSKAELVRAILHERITELDAALVQLSGDAEPFAALSSFVDVLVRMQAEDRGVLRLMAQALGPAALPESVDRLHDGVWKLIKRGQSRGQIRPDVKKADVPRLLRMATAAISPADAACPDVPAALRGAAILLDGLRPR